MSFITLENLTKEYTRFNKEEGLKGSIKSLFKREYICKRAVCDFSLEITEGEFVGLIGPNGAGKTTLMKMLTGIISPTSGRISVLGYVPNELKNAYKKQFAIVMGQKSQLFQDLSAADTFLLLKEIYDIPEEEYRKNLNYLTELFSVKDYLNVQVRTLSLGERMKMELIAALLHDPKILFLDEPTIGLDAVAQKQIREFLKEVNRDRKTTILLTSHYMEDIKSLCKRCVVINHGQKIYDGALDVLLSQYQTHKKITVSFEEATEFLPGSEIQITEQNPFRLSFLAKRGDVNGILQQIMHSCTIEDISIEEEEIGNVIERIYQAQ
ncbi:MAG: ATP-binding cassette domain-containing protein [Ruminiclostridium sp.]|jgi:ABC-2 type transport system ATP-binding protein|nr:ATP-binding cassette domain-containing protein [Ruminiclostridium sp.]